MHAAQTPGIAAPLSAIYYTSFVATLLCFPPFTDARILQCCVIPFFALSPYYFSVLSLDEGQRW